VTALFADLVGSTELAERLDPEDAREVLGSAVRRIIAAVDEYGGTVKDLAGDGVLALFGAPKAHEDDAERAVLCGLRIVEAIRGDATLEVRVGIESGLAVVGAVGGGSHVEYGAVGDAVNTASRLQAHAEPGSVLVGAETRKAVEQRFEWGPAVRLTLKGKSRPAVAATAIRSAPAVDVRRRSTILLGRTHELAALTDAIAELQASRGGVLLVDGAAGIGKSRLVAECRARLDGVTWFEGHCRSYAEATPYALYQDLLLRRLGLRVEDAAERKRAALGSDAQLLAPVLGLQDTSSSGLDPSELQRRTFDAMLSFVGRSAPAAVAVEDLHWADPTSIALTERLLELATSAPVLVIATRRSEVEGPSQRLFEDARGQVLHLGPLPAGSDRALINAIVGDALPEDVTASLLEVSEGNPFFLEQQVEALVDQGSLRLEDGSWRFVGEGRAEVPATVEKVVLSRLDRLDADVRDTLVSASVLGRTFEECLLARVTGRAMVAEDLDSLVAAGLVERLRASGELRFAHAIIQEAAYRTLLREARRDLHRRAGEAAEEAGGEGGSRAAMIGHHFAEAGEAQRAVPYLLRAGDLARDAYANAEAISSYTRALALLDAGSPLEPGLLVRLGDVYRLVGRHEDARDTLERAFAAGASDDALWAAQLHVQLGRVDDELHRYERALERWDAAERELAKITRDAPGRWDAWFDIQDHRMTTLYWLGDTEALAQLVSRIRPEIEEHASRAQQGEFFGRLAQVRLRQNRYVADAEVVEYARAAFAAVAEDGKRDACAWERFALGFALVFADELDEAKDLLETALADAERMGDARLRSRCLTYLLVIARKRGDCAYAAETIDAVSEAARVARLPEYEAIALANGAWVAWRAGDGEATVEQGRAALELWSTLPVRYWYDWMAAFPLAGVAFARGDVSTAVELLRATLAEPQQPLPQALAGAVEGVVEAADRDDCERTAALLERALGLARELSYL
jgi:class 3 adenylate cyclase/tetratricopeptide (TPR) repeat protein